MKITLTHKEANLINAILWELVEECGIVHSDSVWQLSDSGRNLASGIERKLEDANDEHNRKTGKDRDLSGSPKGTILDAKWSA